MCDVFLGFGSGGVESVMYSSQSGAKWQATECDFALGKSRPLRSGPAMMQCVEMMWVIWHWESAYPNQVNTFVLCFRPIFFVDGCNQISDVRELEFHVGSEKAQSGVLLSFAQEERSEVLHALRAG